MNSCALCKELIPPPPPAGICDSCKAKLVATAKETKPSEPSGLSELANSRALSYPPDFKAGAQAAIAELERAYVGSKVDLESGEMTEWEYGFLQGVSDFIEHLKEWAKR